MTKNTLMRLHRIYNAVVSVMIIVSGVLFVLGALHIYYTGESEPYTREIVAQVFSRIAVPVYITLVLVAGGFVFWLLAPMEERKTKRTVLQDDKPRLAKIKTDGDVRELIGIWRKIRFTRLLLTGVELVLLGRFFVYGADPKNFADGDITGSVIRAAYVMTLATALAFGVKLFEIIKCESLSRKAARLEKQLLKNDEVRPYIINCKKKGKISDCAKEKTVLVVKSVLVLIAVAVLLFGLFSGGTADVLTKAMNICTECIGLG